MSENLQAREGYRVSHDEIFAPGDTQAVLVEERPEEIFAQARTNQEAYLKMLGTSELPQNAEAMPNLIAVPLGALEGIQEALTLTSATGKEHSWDISWDSKTGKIVRGKIYQGTEQAIADGHFFQHIFPLIRFKKKDLAQIHTHPENSLAYPSRNDVLGSIATQSGLMTVMCHKEGIAILCPSKEGLKPLFSLVAFEIRKVFEGKNHTLENTLELANKHGWQLYLYHSKSFSVDLKQHPNQVIVLRKAETQPSFEPGSTVQ